MYACAAPSTLSPPSLTEVTSTTIKLAWVEPLSNGACPITGYILYKDDGLTGLPTTQDAALASGVPTLREATVTIDTAELGRTYSFILEAVNREGSATSSKVSYLFAVPPSQPSSGPTIVSTSTTRIVLRYDSVLTSEGGNPPISYQLQYMSAHLGGSWIDLIPASPNSLLTHYTLSGALVTGETYSFRYRVKNGAEDVTTGWGEYSAATSAVAADAPSKPTSAPVIVGEPTATTVTLSFDL